MDRQDFIDAVTMALLRNLLKDIPRHLELMTRCCINCNNWGENSEICNKANLKPPARVIAFGCEMFEEREKF